RCRVPDLDNLRDMADHITIDFAVLEDTSRSLLRLRQEFESAREIADQDAGALGSRDVAHALHDFADDWKLHRQRLVEAMDKLQRAAEDSAKVFCTTDEGLARALDKDAHR